MNYENPQPFDVFESRRKEAIEALYGVQGAIRLIFEGRLQPNPRAEIAIVPIS